MTRTEMVTLRDSVSAEWSRTRNSPERVALRSQYDDLQAALAASR
jgi:hypothetical protein